MILRHSVLSFVQIEYPEAVSHRAARQEISNSLQEHDIRE